MLGRLKRSQFLRDALTLMSGTVMAQFLPIVFAPVMTRIFVPADYGVLGIYMAFSGLLSVLVTSHYNLAIMLPENDDESINLVALCVAISLAIALATLGLVVGIESSARLRALVPDSQWLHWLPLSVFLAGVYTSLYQWTNRKRNYRRLAFSKLGQAIVAITIQLGVGLRYRGPAGMVLGFVGGQVTSTLLLTLQVYRDDRATFARHLRFRDSVALARKHRSFVYFLLPADFINMFTNQIPILLLTRFSGTTSVGNYNFSQRILGLPSSLIASSLVDVFKQRAISDYNATGSCRQIYLKTAKVLALLGLVPLLVMFFGAPWMFAIVFGSKWREAGVYAQWLSALFYLRFVVSPLAYVYYIAGKQREDLVLHIAMAAGSTLSLWLGYRWFKSALGMIALYSVNYSLIYLIYLVRSYMFSKGSVAAREAQAGASARPG